MIYGPPHSRTPSKNAKMRTLFAADVEPTTATMNTDPFTFTEAHLSQEITRKRETQEKKNFTAKNTVHLAF